MLKEQIIWHIVYDRRNWGKYNYLKLIGQNHEFFNTGPTRLSLNKGRKI